MSWLRPEVGSRAWWRIWWVWLTINLAWYALLTWILWHFDRVLALSFPVVIALTGFLLMRRRFRKLGLSGVIWPW
jgi:hypothetical protein